jgi:DNA-binding FadR family transcriptional regulator
MIASSHDSLPVVAASRPDTTTVVDIGAAGDLDPALSRSEALASHLEQLIHIGQLPRGARLGTKTELRQRFKMAAGTVDQVVRLLHARGLIDTRQGPGGGLFVTAPTLGVRLSHLVLRFGADLDVTAADCLAVRNALELPLALDAASHATPADARALDRILREMRRVTKVPISYLQANWRLHRRIAEISPNAVLRGIYLTVLEFLEERLQGVEPDPVFLSTAAENLRAHEELVAAIVAHDVTAVNRAIRRHEPFAGRPGGRMASSER